MQTVYVDILIFINMFEDFLLLLAVKYILRLKIRYIRLTAGSAAGGLFSLVSLVKLPFIISIIIKIFTTLLLVLITFGFKERKLFLKTCACLLMLNFLVSGAMICFYLAIKPNGMIIINDTVYFNISPLLLIILTLIIYFILILFKKLFKNHSKSGLIKNVQIDYKGNSSIIRCKVDSGLNVKEPFSGSSVIIAEKSGLDFTVDKNFCRIIPYTSLKGKGIIYGFKADNITIDGKIIKEEIYIGVCEGIFKTEIKGLIPQNILGE